MDPVCGFVNLDDTRSAPGARDVSLDVDPRKGIMSKRIMPTGQCFCGCGGTTTVGAYFHTGHDRRAESMVLQMLYGTDQTVVAFLDAEGYGPGGKNVTTTYEAWKAEHQ